MHRSFVLALLVSTGCNQVFDIESTMLENEAPKNPMCPSDGISAPQFRDNVVTVLSRECFTYTVSEVADRALGVCSDRGTGVTLELGPIEGELEPIVVAPTPADAYISKAWLSHGGDEIVIHQIHGQPAVHRLNLYKRTGATWTVSSTISESTMFITAGVPSAGPEPRLIESTVVGGYRELAERDGAWVEVRRGLWAELVTTGGVGDNVNLSADGLRMTFTITFDAHYTDRPSLDVPFRVSVPLDTLGEVRSAQLVDNCAKIYFTGLGQVFFRYQQ